MSNFFNYKINESIKYKTYYKPNYHEFEIIIPSPQMIKLNGMPVSTNWLILKKVENEQLYDNPTIYCDNNLFIEYTDITKLKDMPENQYFIFYEFGIIYFHKNLVDKKVIIKYFYVDFPNNNEQDSYLFKHVISIINGDYGISSGSGQYEPETYTNLTPVPVDFGGVKAGETFDNVPITAVLTKLMYPELFPTLTPPSFNVTVNADLVEIYLNATITFNSTFNRGSINPAYFGLSGYRSGPPISYVYSGENLNYTDSTSLLTSIATISNYAFTTAGIKNYSITVNYAEGEQPLTNYGNNYDIPYPAGFITLNRSFKVVYPYFATTENITSLIKQPLIDVLTLNYYQANMVAETDTDKQAIEVSQANGQITGIQFYNSFSGQWEWINGSKLNSLNSFTQSSVIKDLNGTNVNYYRYVHNGSKIGARQLRFFIN